MVYVCLCVEMAGICVWVGVFGKRIRD
jgi:hypothetical protein